MAVWYVDLRGIPLFLKQVSKRYRSGRIKVIEQDGRFKLMSDHFSSLTNEEEVRIKAIDILKKVNGSMQVAMDNYKPIDIHSIAHIDDKGRLNKSIKFTLTVLDAQEETSNDSSMPEALWTEVADKDRSVSKLLDFFGQQLDWVNLYRIWEVIQEDQGSDILKKGWATEKMMSRFEQTANSFNAVGGAARHGHEKVPPPNHPMNIEEARKLIRSISYKWLEEKSNNSIKQQ
jgi:hypothetical protein